MYKVKGKPWAYSGAIDVSDCATAKEVMLKAGLNFNVAKCELVGKMPIKLTGTDEELDRIIKEQKEGAHVFGTDIYRKCDNAFATYRTDFNIPLGVVKSKYTIVQNNDAFNFFDGAIGKNSALSCLLIVANIFPFFIAGYIPPPINPLYKASLTSLPTPKTSPVDFISGPKDTSTFGNFCVENTGTLTDTNFGSG